MSYPHRLHLRYTVAWSRVAATVQWRRVTPERDSPGGRRRGRLVVIATIVKTIAPAAAAPRRRMNDTDATASLLRSGPGGSTRHARSRAAASLDTARRGESAGASFSCRIFFACATHGIWGGGHRSLGSSSNSAGTSTEPRKTSARSGAAEPAAKGLSPSLANAASAFAAAESLAAARFVALS